MTGEELRALVADAENKSGEHAYLWAPLRRLAESTDPAGLVDLHAAELVRCEVTIRIAQECALALLGGPRHDEALAALRELAP